MSAVRARHCPPRPSSYPTRPATIFLKPPGAVLASVVQQARAYVFPNGVRPIEPEGIGLLNLDDAKAAPTLNAKQVAGNFRITGAAELVAKACQQRVGPTAPNPTSHRAIRQEPALLS
jgi:hypothetical protein